MSLFKYHPRFDVDQFIAHKGRSCSATCDDLEPELHVAHRTRLIDAAARLVQPLYRKGVATGSKVAQRRSQNGS